MASTLSSAAEGATGAATAHVAAGPWRYAAFLSYSHSDKRTAARLHGFLESYRIPRDLVGRETARGIVPDRLRPIFRDREDLAAADDLSREIDTALGESRALIVLCSPHAAVSRWTNIEVERFRQLHGDTGIFAAIIDGEPFASDHPARAADECFPPALRQRPTPNGPVRAEPVGADLRREGDGVHAGRLKLVAGILGVPLDELVHRDARRRQRRTLAVVIALLVGLAFTTGLALVALRARDDAVRQRAEAEGLIEFMVTDLRKKLEPAGKLGALDTLGERALAFYRRQDTAALDPDSLGRRARVVQLIGEIQDQRGNLDAALVNFETAAASTAELLSRDPETPNIALITTDGFLYPNAELQKRGILHRKGFPESYDRRALLRFVTDIKSGASTVFAPVYSHLSYDIVPGETIEVSDLISEAMPLLSDSVTCVAWTRHQSASTGALASSHSTGRAPLQARQASTSRCCSAM